MRDPLMCDRCGVDGELSKSSSGFYFVSAIDPQDGKVCCQSLKAASEAEAITNWERLQGDDVFDWDGRTKEREDA